MSSVKVAVRARPLNDRERQLNEECILSMNGNEVTVHVPFTNGAFTHKFLYDYALWSIPDVQSPNPLATQQAVFQEIGTPAIEACFEGFNVCIFAYGQTGSGKSYTMFGEPNEDSEIGLIPRLTHKLFSEIESRKSELVCFRVEASYMEIYNEKVKCLLNPNLEGHSLKVREHPTTGPYVENLTKIVVQSHKEVFRLMHDGNKLRTTAATCMNTHSSRSHALFQLTVIQEIMMEDCDEVLSAKTARVNLVDLAGSERVAKTQAKGTRLLEGANINKSLSTLGQVISALAEIESGSKRKHVPYRDSVLTWILKDNLGGNSKTMMVATVSPAEDNYDETMSTLRYAERAKKIVNRAVVNEDANSALIAALKEEIQRLQQQLEMKGTGEQGSAREELEQNKALMNQLQMTWEEKLAHANEVASRRAREVDTVRQEKEELEAEVEDLLAEKTRQDQELTLLQEQLMERDQHLDTVLEAMKKKEREFEAKLREMEKKRRPEAEGATDAQQSRTERQYKQRCVHMENELTVMRQEMAAMTAQLEQQKRAGERKKQLDAALPHQVQALLQTLRIDGITDEEKLLLQAVSVKDMALVYDEMAQGIDTSVVWNDLLNRLEERQASPRTHKDPKSDLDSLLDDDEEEQAKLPPILDDTASSVDELQCFSPTRKGSSGGPISFFENTGGHLDPGSPPPLPAHRGQEPQHEQDELSKLLEDEEEEGVPAGSGEADKLLDQILGDAPPEQKGGDLLDELLPDNQSKGSSADLLDELLDGSSEDDKKEEQDLLDELLDEPADTGRRLSTAAQDTGAAVDMDQLLEGDEAEGDDDILDQLLGDNIQAAEEYVSPVKDAAPPVPASALIKATAAGDKVDALRVRVWNVALFNASSEVSKEGESYVASLLARALEEKSTDRGVAAVVELLGGVEPKQPFGEGDTKQRLINFYAFYRRSKIADVDDIIAKGKIIPNFKVVDYACKKYQGAEPEMLEKPPSTYDELLKHWFWGSVLKGRGPPRYCAEDDQDDDAELVDSNAHPLAGSPKAVRAEGPVPASKEYWRSRLVRFFKKYDPQRSAESIEQLLTNFQGMEEQMMKALVNRYGPEPGVAKSAPTKEKSKGITPTGDDYGSSNNPIRLDINSVAGHGSLLSGFKVQKINPNYGKMKGKLSKDRVWIIDFFRRVFCNVSGGRATQVHPANHLFRIERVHQYPRQLRLCFYKAPHPYILEFLSCEARQRFFELAWALRRHICYNPSLVPSKLNTVSVSISGKSKKYKEVSGTATIHLTKDPAEILTVWCGSMSLGGRLLPPVVKDTLPGFLPKPTKYDLHFLCLSDLPEVYSRDSLELVRYFKRYCGECGIHPFLSTNLGSSTSVVIAMARKRHIIKIGNMEAIELRDQNTMVIGLSLRYAETSLALVSAQLKPALPTAKKNRKVATIMNKLDIGDLKAEFTSRFDYIVWLGRLGYGGAPHTNNDELASEMNSGLVLSAFTEARVTGNSVFTPESARCFVKTSRPSSMHPISYSTPDVSHLIPGKEATVFAAAMLMCRPYLGSLVQQRPKPSQFLFTKLTVTITYKEVVSHLGQYISLAAFSPYIEGDPVIVKMKWMADKQQYVAMDEDTVPPVHLVTNTEEFLRHQYLTFTVVHPKPTPTPDKPSHDFPFTAGSSGLLALKHYCALNTTTPFRVSLLLSGLKVGTLCGDITHRGMGSKDLLLDPMKQAVPAKH